MDCLTANHLNAWMKRSVPEHLQDATLDLIFSALDEYPELLKDRSWDQIRTVGERMKERRVR